MIERILFVFLAIEFGGRMSNKSYFDSLSVTPWVYFEFWINICFLSFLTFPTFNGTGKNSSCDSLSVPPEAENILSSVCPPSPPGNNLKQIFEIHIFWIFFWSVEYFVICDVPTVATAKRHHHLDCICNQQTINDCWEHSLICRDLLKWRWQMRDHFWSVLWR